MSGCWPSAPQTAATLTRPAAGAAARAEKQLDLRFTDELREWFSLHGGASQDWPGDRPEAAIVPFYVPLSADEAVRSAQTWRKVEVEAANPKPDVP